MTLYTFFSAGRDSRLSPLSIALQRYGNLSETCKKKVKNFIWYDLVLYQTNYYTISYKTFRYEVVLPS